jgi:hypothetical protein
MPITGAYMKIRECFFSGICRVNGLKSLNIYLNKKVGLPRVCGL